MRWFTPILAAGSFVALAIALAILWLIPSVARARPTIRQSFFNAYPSAAGSRLDNLPSHATHCGVCHYDFNGGGTRNPYGVRLGNVLPDYGNNDAGRQQAMHSIEGEDSDADGHSTLAEVTDLVSYSNTPTFPGLTPSNVGQASNVPVLAEIQPYLVPVTGADTSPPTVTITAPNGAESWTGGASHAVTWTAADNVGVVSLDLFYRDAESAPWTMIARGLANTGSFPWFVHNTPTTAARVRAVARDAAGNSGADSSNALFTIVSTAGGIAPTTLRDFHQPGTQPFGGGSFQDHTACVNCHGGYDSTVEPGHNFKGSMMAQAARDPLFFACLAIAEQDAPGSGDLCLRCHTPFGWMSGRSQPTSGSQLTALDRDGVACDFCHRAVDPIYQPGISPPEDQTVLNGLLPAHVPNGYSNGQYVADPEPRRRGPFADAIAPHAILESPLHRSSDFCGTCHDVSNPAFTRVSGADYAPGPFDQAADPIDSAHLMPLERTYSEWKNSAYPAGVYAPDFAGNKPDGMVASCQDCHMHDVAGKGCNDPGVVLRQNLPLHDMTGGSSWMPNVIAALYPGETDPVALNASAARAVSMLQKAATLQLAVAAAGDSYRAIVTVTNRAGHRLPTGYPEGRRMWLHVTARNAGGTVVYESGAYDPASGVLAAHPDLAVYEAHLGLSPALASALGLPDGPSFHFALNDTILKDNRIPPLGFTNAAFAAFGGAPVDPGFEGPGSRYPDGQNWDAPAFPLPAASASVAATLYYQSTSKEYVEFLRDQNTTNSAGDDMHAAWAAHGRAAPVAMAGDSVGFGSVAVDEAGRLPRADLRVGTNPFRGSLDLRLELARSARVVLEIVDLGGRRVARLDHGVLGAGAHRILWDGRDGRGRDVGSGVFWACVEADGERCVRRAVRLR